MKVTSEHPYLAIEVKRASGAQMIALAGEADLLGVPKLQAAFTSVCTGEPSLIVLDLRDLTFIDSSGLHALIAGHQLCRAHGHDLKAIAGPASVQRLFEITGMMDIFPFVDPEDVFDGNARSRDESAPSA